MVQTLICGLLMNWSKVWLITMPGGTNKMPNLMHNILKTRRQRLQFHIKEWVVLIIMISMKEAKQSSNLMKPWTVDNMMAV